jgi:murein DD-endopeptidase MepM/ murein hydrolase activator NlpD
VSRVATGVAAPAIAGAVLLSGLGASSAAAAAPPARAATGIAATTPERAASTATRAFPPLRYGSRGSGVLYVQAKLGVLPRSGYFGPLTQAAVKRFQATFRLPATGVVDATTYTALGRHTTGSWYRPLASYRLTAHFGQRGRYWATYHTGLDLAAPTGTTVRSIGDGVIIFAGWAGAYGNRVDVRHYNGVVTRYAHLSSIHRRSGALKAGWTVGRVGATGNVTGPHLHLEARPNNGSPVDPAAYLAARGVRV